MLKIILVFFIFFTAFNEIIVAQDTLPKISVKNRGGRIIISWINPYGAKISNINIQRSFDSLKRFTTVGSVLNPLNKENGFVDSKTPVGRIFYRVFVAFEGGDYIFTRSYQPVLDTSTQSETELEMERRELERELQNGTYHGFVPSKFVYTGKDNNVIISLANAASQKYSIRFFDENDNPVFELRTINESYLILDKVNFLHSGWFKYHLLNNNILLEKFKFFIPKDGKSITAGKERYK